MLVFQRISIKPNCKSSMCTCCHKKFSATSLEPSWPGLSMWGLDNFLAQGRHPCPCRGRRWYSPPFQLGSSWNVWYPRLYHGSVEHLQPQSLFCISAKISDVRPALPHFISLMALITSLSGVCVCVCVCVCGGGGGGGGGGEVFHEVDFCDGVWVPVEFYIWEVLSVLSRQLAWPCCPGITLKHHCWQVSHLGHPFSGGKG